MGGKVWSEEESTKFAKGIDVLENIFRQRLIHKPWLRIDWIFKLTSLYRQQKQVLSDTNASVDKVIQNRRQSHRPKAEKHFGQSDYSVSTIDEDSRPKERLAFLDLLMVKASEENSDMNDEVLRNEVSTFMAAGLDSTAVAFNWFLYLIAKHPDHQKLVTDELDLIFGDSDRPVTAQDLTRLKYLECCIKETLRLYPPFPAVSRYLSEDVQSGGYTLPRGLTVVINIFAAHHDPTVFSDPDAFKPERFLPENSFDRHPYAFIPFSAGPRNCIAQKYAMMELKVCLANILRRLKFSLVDPSAPLEIPSPQLLLKPKDGKCNLIVSKRLDIS
ncbi:cytochrome P450 4c3-like [Daphnia pulex]|uniref:cytochrome P450 4c3-like n=1 Tax=Daphnia pulex TaxID=6669 RepID=UPI001EDE2B68|nr:cytochrome P450 4c3-like [Daphnia pulex]